MRQACLTVAAILAVACDGSQNASQPVVSDSAGIRIVTSSSPKWAAGRGWRLSEQPVTAIGAEGDTLYELARITGAIRLSDGSVVIAMRRPHVVYRYDSTGRFVNAIGRAGQGPEEYDQPQTVLPMPGDSVLVPDYGGSPIFSHEGAVGGRVRLAPSPRAIGESAKLGPLPKFTFADGSMAGLDQVYAMRQKASSGGTARTDSLEIVRYSRDGALLGSFGVFDSYYFTCDERECTPQIASLDRYFAAGPDRFFTGNGETFEIRAYDLDGRVRRIMRIDRPAIPFTDDSMSARAEREAEQDPERAIERRAFYRKATHRDSLPHFSGMVAGADGTLWVGEYTTTFEPTRWQVFDREGVWLGTMDLPQRFVLENVYADVIIGRQRNELDVERVVVHRLIKEP